MLYGTTTFGGPNNRGTVFRISPNGALFDTVASEVGNPQGSLLADRVRPYAPPIREAGRAKRTIFRIELNTDGLSG